MSTTQQTQRTCPDSTGRLSTNFVHISPLQRETDAHSVRTTTTTPIHMYAALKTPKTTFLVCVTVSTDIIVVYIDIYHLLSGGSPWSVPQRAFYIPVQHVDKTWLWARQNRGYLDIMKHPNTGCMHDDHRYYE